MMGTPNLSVWCRVPLGMKCVWDGVWPHEIPKRGDYVSLGPIGSDEMLVDRVCHDLRSGRIRLTLCQCDPDLPEIGRAR